MFNCGSEQKSRLIFGADFFDIAEEIDANRSADTI